jgi:sigma-B regulation protein RsbU (phosphoserine phosphatase)
VSSTSATGLRILVADDQPDIQHALRLLLTDAGFEVDLVGAVDAAVDHVSRRRYDLLLMDLNYTRDTTSGREGLDLIDRVRAFDGALPVVVMTGWGSVDTAVDAMRRGARSFVQKPWDDTTLIEVVRREIADGAAARRRDASRVREDEEARLIQRTLLPSELPRLEGCEVAARWTPASGIGGDCFDVIRFDDGRFSVSVADVVGKGLPAALLMSNLQAAARAFSTSAADPDDICRRVNRLLCRNIAIGKFVTFCSAVVDTSARSVAYANAGHNAPVLLHRDGRVEHLLPTGPILGVSPDWTYTTLRLGLEPGDCLLLYTDGITEARSPEDEEFGEERLIDLMRAHRTLAPDPLVQVIADTVAAWAGGAAQDDTTLVAVAIDG